MCSPSAPTPSSSTAVQDLPDWAKGYAKDTLAKTAALTDISKNPYQTYGGERVAGFQPLQQQAFTSAAGMNAGPEGFAQGIGSYMSPYMQNVVDIEKREAGRQAGIAGTQQQAQATQAGAFGGGRDAIMRAERERNLAQQMGDIQAKGSQAAYEQAANQFRQGIQQQGAVTQLQSALGQTQQQQAQRPLDVAYQDFINQQNYPYKQLGYMSDMIRGLPLGQKSTAQTYEAPGSVLGQLAGLGVGIGGMSKLFADGGLAFADGGVTDPQNVESILSKLSDVQLKQAHQAALDRRDVNEAQMIESEMAQRAAMRQGTEQEPFTGIAPALPNQFADDMEQNMATGGIVAFAGGDKVDAEKAQRESDKAAMLQALEDMKTGVKKSGAAFLDIGTLPFRAIAGAGETAITRPLRALGLDIPYLPESYYGGDSSSMTPYMDKIRKEEESKKPQAPKQKLPQMSPEDMAKIDARNAAIKGGIDVDKSGKIVEPKPAPVKSTEQKYTDITSGPKPSKAQVKSAVEQLTSGTGTDTGSNVESESEALQTKLRKQYGAESQPIIDEMKKMIEGQKPDTEGMKSQGLNQALAEFGFKMAANAARPGARFLESASTAAPALSAAAAKTQELITAAQQNYAKLRIEQAKYETALQKNDMQTAATAAGQIIQAKQQDKLLQFHIAEAKDRLALEQQKLASQNAYQQASLSRYETVGSLTKDIMRNEGLPYGQALEKAGNIMKGGIPAGLRAESATSVQLQKDIDKIDDAYRMWMMVTKDPAKLAELQAKRDAEVRAKMQNAGRSNSGAGPSGGAANPTSGWGDLRVKQ
jgi:hypothetical protein